MVNCIICEERLLSVKALRQHLAYVHGFVNLKDLKTLTCRENVCEPRREFSEFNSFRKHLINVHHVPSDTINQNTSRNEMNSDNAVDIVHNSEEEESVALNFDRKPPLSDTDNFKKFVKQGALKYISKLYADSSLNRSVVQSIIDNTTEFLQSGFITDLKHEITSSLENGNVHPSVVSNIKEKVSMLENPFDGLTSEHNRFKEMTDSGYYIPPVSYTVGYRFSEKSINGKVHYEAQDVKAQHIPLIEVLKCVFQVPGLLKATLAYTESLKIETEITSNFVQGFLWQKKTMSFSGKTVLPIFIYVDDYEVGNPLGSHAGVHKMCGVYASVPCMPPEIQSKLRSILLTLLFHSDDRAEFGNRAVFKILIQELDFLQTEGIRVCTDDGEVQLYFVLGLLIGDNAGLNSICGFVESFSANYCCRLCKAPKAVRSKMLIEDPSLLRDKVNYLEDVSKCDPSLNGVKESCVWHDLPGFHVTENYAVDVMHDLLEGVMKSDLALILKHFIITKKMFSLDEFNFMIRTFNYGPYEECRPPTISQDNLVNGKLPYSASEMLCFVRYVGVILGEHVDKNDEAWQLFLVLRQILDLVVTKSLQKSCHSLLSTLVAEHHELYISVFNESLKPKHHNMVHYGRCMQMCGPLALIWCMRFEAKHRPSKIAARSTTCRKNTPLTLATRHQLELSSYLQDTYKPCDIVPFGGSKQAKVTDIVKEIPIPEGLDPNEICQVLNSISLCGIKYKPGCVIVSNVDDKGPMFCVLLDTILVSVHSEIYFLCNHLLNHGFDCEVHAYEVSLLKSKVLINYSLIADKVPAWCVNLSNCKTYVVLRSSI